MCKKCSNLRTLIRQGMLYWFARTILDMGATPAGLFATGQSKQIHEVYRNRARRKKYAALRAEGKSNAEAVAVLNGTTAKVYKAKQARIKRRYRDRWGGYPGFGTRAWVRRETFKLAQKMGA